MSKINIKNLNISFDDKVLCEKFNLEIKSNNYTVILGPCSSGKTVLFKTIINGNKSIKVNGKFNYIHTDPKRHIVAKTVLNQLKFFLEQEGYTKRQIITRVKNIMKYFDLEKYKDIDPSNMSDGYKQLVVLCSYLTLDLDILIMDNALCKMDRNLKKKVIEYFNKLKKKKVTIINFASDTSELNGSDYTIIINKGKVYEDNTKNVINNTKIFEDNNLEVPFFIDVKAKFKYYDILDDDVNSVDELVESLWK